MEVVMNQGVKGCILNWGFRILRNFERRGSSDG